QSFSTAHLQLRLNSNLPPNFVNWLRVAALPMEQLVSSTLYNRAEAEQAKLCNFRLNCLLNSLPLVMFILPGTLPLVGKQLLQFKRQVRRRQRQKKH
ncbi:MAG TPA: hypothetical protein V6C65_22390, partial [Allocoleopsis sp.]